MRKLSVLAVFVSFLLFLTSCQPTPNIKEEVLPSSNEIKSDLVIQESLTDGIHLNINADVVNPVSKNYFKTYVVKQQFSQDMINHIASIMFGDVQYYEYKESKEYLENYLVVMHSQLQKYRNNLDESTVEFVDFVDQEIRTSLGKNDFDLIPADVNNINSYPDKIIQADLGRETFADFQVHNEVRNVVTFRNFGFKTNTPTEYNFNKADLIDQANNIMKSLEIFDDFSVVYTGEEEINYTFIESELSNIPKHQRFTVKYLRKFDDLDQIYVNQLEYGTIKNIYNKPSFFEIITFEFDKDGLVYFRWEEPYKVVKSEPVTNVISLETATEKTIEHLKTSINKYTYPDIEATDITINISKIILGMCATVTPDSTFEVIPVWEFIGNIEYKNPSTGQNICVETDMEEGVYSICTINGITQKVIDRGIGY